jgi:hypothetical protein
MRAFSSVSMRAFSATRKALCSSFRRRWAGVRLDFFGVIGFFGVTGVCCFGVAGVWGL